MRLLSIIVPIYNVERYLRRCIDSILAQKGNFDYEILLINDGSPDNSQEIIDEYVNKFPDKIRSLYKENGGLSSARNYGINQATGKYLLFIDSDDYIEPTLLYETMPKIKNNNAMMCIFDYHLTTNSGEKKHKKIFNKNNHYIVGKQAAWARIYHKDLFKHTHFPEGINYEDLAIIPFLIAETEGKIVYVDKPLYNYIVDNSGSIMNTYNEKIFDIYHSLEYLFELFRNSGTFEKYRCELQYLALEHLGIGHSYRLFRYPQKKIKHYRQISSFMVENFGPNWQRNKYIEQKIHEQNIPSIMGTLTPTYLVFMKLLFSPSVQEERGK